MLVEAQPWSLNCRDARGRSAAHWAAVRGATDALEALVARGADVRSRDAGGWDEPAAISVIRPSAA
jgi:ankyrin repeat protein